MESNQGIEYLMIVCHIPINLGCSGATKRWTFLPLGRVPCVNIPRPSEEAEGPLDEWDPMIGTGNAHARTIGGEYARGIVTN